MLNFGHILGGHNPRLLQIPNVALLLGLQQSWGVFRIVCCLCTVTTVAASRTGPRKSNFNVEFASSVQW
eukprot:6157046-Amphidinium_carterae.1